MFTGIVEAPGTVKEMSERGTNRTFWISAPIADQLKVGQSLAHDGVCLTVEEIQNDQYRVTAVEETLAKTNLDQWAAGTLVNLERSLQLASRLDGHFVQGHVDATGVCKKLKDKAGSWEITFEYPKKYAALVIEKGSICVNGVSLTAFDVDKDSFKVAIIPYTWNHTNLSRLARGVSVNLEFDILGKYILRKLAMKS